MLNLNKDIVESSCVTNKSLGNKMHRMLFTCTVTPQSLGTRIASLCSDVPKYVLCFFVLNSKS